MDDLTLWGATVIGPRAWWDKQTGPPLAERHLEARPYVENAAKGQRAARPGGGSHTRPVALCLGDERI
ncbi:MAG: hypothetical protein KKF88_07160, partial [Alphaproteobacteria bacterium]|nr:hypothetical protein [Alphaproteobacteria bacterium]